MGKLTRVGGIGARRGDGELIDARLADVADELALVELQFYEPGRETVEQFGIRGRVADAHVVDRIDHAASEELCPDPIGQVSGENVVVGRSQPCGERGAWIPLAWHRLHRAQCFRGLRLSGDGIHGRVGLRVPVDPLLPRLDTRLPLHSREEAHETVVVVHRPAIEGVVVTLGTLDLNAQEQLREIGRKHLGIDARLVNQHRVEVGGAGTDIRSRRRHHLGDELVERTVGPELGADPVGEFVCRFDDGGIGRVVAPHHAQLFRPEGGLVVGEVIGREEGIDLSVPFVGRTVAHKRGVLIDGRRTGHEIQRDAAQKCLVIA